MIDTRLFNILKDSLNSFVLEQFDYIEIIQQTVYFAGIKVNVSKNKFLTIYKIII